jgi:hypothetical protein
MKKSRAKLITSPALWISLMLGVVFGGYVQTSTADPGWTCPNPEITVGSCTCTANGCHLYNNYAWVCNYSASGTGCQGVLRLISVTI